jgi:hypothetical protein
MRVSATEISYPISQNIFVAVVDATARPEYLRRKNVRQIRSVSASSTYNKIVLN